MGVGRKINSYIPLCQARVAHSCELCIRGWVGPARPLISQKLVLRQGINFAKLFLNFVDALGTLGMLAPSLRARNSCPPFSVGTIATYVPEEHSSNDLSLCWKIQTNSVAETLVLAMPLPLFQEE